MSLDKFERIDELSVNELRNLYLQTIAKGCFKSYEFLSNTKSIKANYLLEQALVYGRFQILEHMLNQDSYKQLLKMSYDPFLLENCNPDVANDINDGSWWSNDEHERRLVNKKKIDHKKCFELLKPYDKKLTINNYIKWLNLACNQLNYQDGTYFASYNILFDEIYDNKCTIRDLVDLLKELYPANFILKVLTKIFPAEILVKKLVEYA